MKKSFFLIAASAAIVLLSLISCEKEGTMSKSVPSPMLAERGTEIANTTPCADSVREFVRLFQQCRAKFSTPPVFYDNRIMDSIRSTETISAGRNKVNSVYYVTDADGFKQYGRFTPYYNQRTIDGPHAFFDEVTNNPESYREFTGENLSGRFFDDYDLMSVTLTKYIDGCLAGKYKMTIIVWIGMPEH